MMERGRLVLVEFRSVLHIIESRCKIGGNLWHPAAQDILTNTVRNHTAKPWDFGAPEHPCAGSKATETPLKNLALDRDHGLRPNACEGAVCWLMAMESSKARARSG